MRSGAGPGCLGTCQLLHPGLAPLLLATAFLAPSAGSQTTGRTLEALPSLQATRTLLPPRIDGRLDEPAWVAAPVARGFRQVDPQPGAPATHDTSVRLLFDDENLYVAAECADPAGAHGVRLQDLRRDFDFFSNDLFGVTFDPYGDGRGAVAFQVNPAGALRDLQVFDDEFYDREWDAVWRARTHVGPHGWSAEIAIPWNTLRYRRTAQGAAWGVNFVRVVRRLNEQSGWSPWPREYSAYRMTYAGRLTGLEPPTPALNLRVQPYVVARAESTETGGRRSSRTSPSVGADVKWAVRSDLALDLSVNTDFAQADADRQVVNLSRFSVFFPERRPFFLENASLFSVGSSRDFEPFFTRRVGLGDDGRPLPIEFGARLSGRDARRGFGALLARSGARDGAPRSDFALGRYQHNLGGSNRLGGLVVARQDDAPGGATFNGVAALDAFFRFGQRYSAYGVVSGSRTRGAGGDGAAAHLWLAHRSRQGYVGWMQSLVTRGYRADAGYVARQDVIFTSPAADLDLRPAWKPRGVRALTPAVSAFFYHGASDRRLQEGYVRARPLSVTFEDGGRAALYAEPNWQVLGAPFEPLPGLVVAPGRYTYTRYGARLESDASRRCSATLDASLGGYFDGRLDSLDLTLRAVPSPRLSTQVRWERNAIRSLGAREGARTTHLVQPELRAALDPRLQLVGVWQYNTAARRASWNLRLSWEFRPLSFIHAVWNDLRPTDDRLAPRERQRQFIVKVTLLQPF